MARPRKTYSQEEINTMTEKKMLKLFEDGRIDDDAVQRWYDNREEIEIMVKEAEAEFGMVNQTEVVAEVYESNEQADVNTEGTDNPIEEDFEEEYERANRVAMEVSDEGYVAHFYRTHKKIGSIPVATVEGVHSAEAREMARAFAIDQCPQYGIEWKPELQKQAWERRHNVYFTDEQIAEDTSILIAPMLDRLAEKSRYDMMVNGIQVVAVTPKESQFSYVEDGRYTKNGAWCVAFIELELEVMVSDHSMRIPFEMEMKSGQICKPKTTIAEWNEKIGIELELNGIVIEDKQTA